MKDRNNITLKIGDKVKQFDRKNENYTGIIVAINKDRLPLIDVDCGVEFVRGIPHFDLIHC